MVSEGALLRKKGAEQMPMTLRSVLLRFFRCLLFYFRALFSCLFLLLISHGL